MTDHLLILRIANLAAIHMQQAAVGLGGSGGFPAIDRLA